MSSTLVARRALLGALISLPLLQACTRCSKPSDAELAAEERRKAEELWQGSLALMPWRAIKGAVRSRTAASRPEIYRKVDETLVVLSKTAGTPAEQAARTTASVELLAYLLIHRADLMTHDEDKFPRLANVLTETAPPLPAPWYDNEAEHLMVALCVLALDAADKSERVPARDIVFYELSRARAHPGWPASLRLIARYARGLVYLQHELHYAAEEELTAYLADAKQTPKGDLVILAELLRDLAEHAKLEPAQAARESLLALGHLTRAHNRLKLEREEPATDDLEAALASLDRLGIENELTLWARAVVCQRRGRYGEGAAALDKLAQSPYLDEGTRRDVKDAAQALRSQSGDPGFFHKQRTTVALAQAVLARLGGVRGALTILVGKEHVERWLAPFTAMSRAREALRDAAVAQGERFRGLAAGAGESGKKAFLDLRRRLTDAGAR